MTGDRIFLEISEKSSVSLVFLFQKCLDVEHDEHSVRRLKRYLTEQIEKKLGNKLEDGLTSYQKQINETVETLNCLDDETQQAIRNYKLKSQRTRALVKQNLDKLSLVQEASAMLSIEEEKRERLAETSLLLRLGVVGNSKRLRLIKNLFLFGF